MRSQTAKQLRHHMSVSAAMTGLEVLAAGLYHRQVLVISCFLKLVSAVATIHQRVPPGMLWTRLIKLQPTTWQGALKR